MPIPDDPFAGEPAIGNASFDCRSRSAPTRRSENSLDCYNDVDCDGFLVVGHRGAGGDFALYAPENSRAALKLAALLGADAIEIDVRTAADDILVVMHDSTTERTTPVNADVGATSAAELTSIRLDGTGFSGDFDCETVPTFSEMLELARDSVTLVVDTKTSRGDLVAEAIRDAQMLEQAVVSVSDPATALAARTAVPEVRIQLRPDTVPEYEAMVVDFARPPEVLEVPLSELANFRDVADRDSARLFTNVFIEDALALATGELEEYDVAIRGADVAQTEFPFFLLERLGRRWWSSLPENRDIGFSSPLLPDKND